MMRDFGDEGRTVLFATHHLAEADEIAERVVVLNHGKVVADGPERRSRRLCPHGAFVL